MVGIRTILKTFGIIQNKKGPITGPLLVRKL